MVRRNKSLASSESRSPQNFLTDENSHSLLSSTGSEEEENWRVKNPDGYKLQESAQITGSSIIHKAAQRGDVSEVKKLLMEKPHLLNSRDADGWMPLHVSIPITLPRYQIQLYTLYFDLPFSFHNL